MMDALADPLCERVVIMTSAQIGKTEVINNALGFFIDHDPCPILLVQPTLELGEAWSKIRLAPMLRDTPVLAEKVGDPKSKTSGNTLREKKFPGGQITVIGANSPTGLSSRPIRVALFDEVDRYPPSAGTEGDPINLGMKRTAAFWNRKIVMTSTPTLAGFSRIASAYEDSSQGQYHVPCAHCGAFHVLSWANVKWHDDDPSTAHILCPECEQPMGDPEITHAVREGKWVDSHPDRKRIRGFHLNELYSPWVPLETTVTAYLEATRGGPELMKTWTNTALGEVFEEDGTSVEPHVLYRDRREVIEQVPPEAKWVTAGVDVQIDRLEVEIVAWAPNRESWSIDYRVLHGDPRVAVTMPGSPWVALDALLATEYRHGSDEAIRITRCFVDSGAFTDHVYAYTRPRQAMGVYACKGVAGEDKPAIASKANPGALKARVFTVGVDGIKATTYSRLAIAEAGEPGYCHFPLDYEMGYFEQLTSERLIPKRTRQGFIKREWELAPNMRNEALDCRVYATAALEHIAPARSVLLARPVTASPATAPKVPAGRFTRAGGFSRR